ncbi:uncharacterized mitochondrial protein AtMg01250-like [Rutidosis leptorrhynchoides]|uniref:uncharacterized mitochondrial protein AtMg01250-like n=1 Tax=Rutidosis leptorrhynchoides TaxID=125765 RepID=UPI003A9A3ADA
MGFGSRWIKWIEACLKSASISVLVNGSSIREFNLQKGVRQGDPISSFLFILAIEGLNILIKRAVDVGLFQSVKVRTTRVPITHPQYADDTILIGASIDEVNVMASKMGYKSGTF